MKQKKVIPLLIILEAVILCYLFGQSIVAAGDKLTLKTYIENPAPEYAPMIVDAYNAKCGMIVEQFAYSNSRLLLLSFNRGERIPRDSFISVSSNSEQLIVHYGSSSRAFSNNEVMPFVAEK